LMTKGWAIWQRQCEGDFETKGKKIFVEHNDNVRQLAKGRLLDFTVQEGW